MFTMTKLHKRRLLFVMISLVGLAIAIGLILYALRTQANYYFTPYQIAHGAVHDDQTIRAGGMVVKHSLKQQKDSLSITFKITDFNSTIDVAYTGIVPDLFKEGTGVVVTGKWLNHTFMAEQILAKHDENYMPPDVVATLKAQGKLPLTPPKD